MEYFKAEVTSKFKNARTRKTFDAQLHLAKYDNGTYYKIDITAEDDLKQVITLQADEMKSLAKSLSKMVGLKPFYLTKEIIKGTVLEILDDVPSNYVKVSGPDGGSVDVGLNKSISADCITKIEEALSLKLSAVKLYHKATGATWLTLRFNIK